MLILLSPAKTQQFEKSCYTDLTTSPFISETKAINSSLKLLSVDDIAKQMKIKVPLAQSTYDNIHSWNECGKNIKYVDAMSGFSGPAFKALDPQTLSSEAIDRAKSQLIILSGLYGVLHANNRFMPYRLEMGLNFKPDGELSLTKYWKPKISTYLLDYCKKMQDNLIINLASTEYSKAVVIKDDNVAFATIDFKELRDGKLKSISSYAKQARGLMARYILENASKTLEDIKKFSSAGYSFSIEHSAENLLTFIRES